MPTAKVLVVDDEAMIRWSIEQTLRGAGYEVAVAETGADGMGLFRAVHPDVVFLDVRLPDDDGFALLRRMKKESNSAVAVVMMTAFDDERTATDAIRLGAAAYLKKPFDFDSLVGIVVSALEAAPQTNPNGATHSPTRCRSR